MGDVIRWVGTGEPVVVIPGWNTSAAMVVSWMPEPFLSRFRCGVVEWPGLGARAESDLPESLEGFLAGLAEGLPAGPLPVVGFCLGGVAAWALAQGHPERVSLSVLVDTPLHFPAVLAPLLVPGVGPALIKVAQGTAWGRGLVSRAILKRRAAYPLSFMDTLFDFDGRAAIHYVRLFRRYGRSIRGPHKARRPCWQVVGRAPLRVLALSLGERHRIEAGTLSLDGAGHFPAVEAPGPFFDCLSALIETAPGARLAGAGFRGGGRAIAGATLALSIAPSGPAAPR
jgi:pimeloyl-ACP methyl ester carboxylesterase